MISILKNAKIYTADKKNLWVDTIAFDGKSIVYAGSFDKLPDDIKAMKNCETYDLKGKMVIPGIIDSHIHPSMIASTTWHVKLPLTYDKEELLGYIKEYALQHPKEEVPFLYFEYYPTEMFGADGPDKSMLDRAVSDRPCLVQDFGEHMAWINSKMLEMLEVDKNTPDPDSLAVFVRDANGEPTGFVKEMAWMNFADNMYQNIGWQPPEKMTRELMLPVLNYLTEHGVTAMVDALIEDESSLQVIAELDKANELNLYYDGYVRCDSLSQLPGKLEEAQRYQSTYGRDRIKINTMKLFLDGTNEGGNAYLIDPKENDPEKSDHGQIGMSEDELVEYLICCNERGMDIHIHLVGDGSFRICCNAMERVKAKLGEKWTVQLTLAHCELVHPDDMLRPAELGININWTPRWAGGCYGEQAKKYIGEKKWNSMYNFNPMIEAGIPVAFSSDVINWGKVERANPFFGMQIGITRVDIVEPLDPNRFPGSVRPPESAKLKRDTMLYGSTFMGAKQMHWENIMGSIEKGKLANLAILSDNFFEVDEFEISKIKCETVIFEGKLVHGDLI